MANNTNNNNKLRDTNRFNDILATNLDSTINDRYCRKCNVRLVHNPRNSQYDKYIYSCPICNCTSNIHQTQPAEKLIVTFPTNNNNNTSTNNKNKLVVQADKERLSRSNYFIQKNIQKKNEIEHEDPHLALFKRNNNKITITSIEYNDPTEDYD